MPTRLKEPHGKGMTRGMEFEALPGQSCSFHGRLEAILVPGGGVFGQVWDGRVRKDPPGCALSCSAPVSPKERDSFRREREKARPLVFDGGEGHCGLFPKEVLPSQAKQLGAAQAGEDRQAHFVGVGRGEVGE